MSVAPAIHEWLTPAQFAIARPQLAAYPLTAISDALVRLRRNGVAVLEGPEYRTVYVVNPSHALSVEVLDCCHYEEGYHGPMVCLPPPLGGTAQPHFPVPVVDIATVLVAINKKAYGHDTPAT